MDYKTILRHHLATLAFRTNYAIKNVQSNYSYFSIGQGVRPPGDILLHIVQLIKVVDDRLNGQDYIKIEIDGWENIIKGFYTYIKKLDSTIKNLKDADEDLILKLYQGPLSDAMTHVGQLMTIRRMSNDALDGLNFFREDSIKIGKFDY